MPVALLLITHDQLGEVLLNTARGTLGCLPLSAETIAVDRDQDPEALRAQARASLERLDDGSGVLVLTDMYGATPSNIATSLSELERVRVVAGLNLPMLLKICNYPTLELDALEATAFNGGRNGVLLSCGPDGVCSLEENPRA